MHIFLTKKIFWGVVVAYTLYSIIELVIPFFKYKKFDKDKWETVRIGDSLKTEELGMADFFIESKQGKNVHSRSIYGSEPYYVIYSINGKVVDKYYRKNDKDTTKIRK
ncbi:hypothetical protein AD998_14530 [bacterium 336/3]|nr:hypothetical protein AD998_14530 [bacterium 336/3]